MIARQTFIVRKSYQQGGGLATGSRDGEDRRIELHAQLIRRDQSLVELFVRYEAERVFRSTCVDRSGPRGPHFSKRIGNANSKFVE